MSSAPASIAVIETDLRRLVAAVLGAQAVDGHLGEILGEEAVAGLERRRDEEQRRRAPAGVPQSLIHYTHFYELRKLIDKRWEQFKPALDDKQEFRVFADKIEDFRNAPAHSRELLPHERTLLEGIAGTIRGRVTAYVSSTDPTARFYPVLESARDHFGNEADLNGNDFFWVCPTDLRLQVGDQVIYEARAWDLQNRDLLWQVGPIDRLTPEFRVASGQDVSLTWVVTEDDVAASNYAYIVMRAAESKYHRHQDYDHRVAFGYAIDPPESS